MSVETFARMLPDTYLELVRKFPLTHIEDDAHRGAAQAVIDSLLRQDLDEGGEAYLDALTDLVEVYEDENVNIPTATPGGVLRELMNANRLSQRDLEDKVGISQSTISAILNGVRSPTADHIVKLANFFNVDPGLFLPSA